MVEGQTQAPTHCARCGRLLTDPRSVKIGMGPVCARKARQASSTIPTAHGHKDNPEGLIRNDPTGLIRNDQHKDLDPEPLEKERN
jgi:hypothetical protein